ncbi:hypothetical protein [Aeromonas hydrophila]|uniref:hypothetical protein n=1 Tax=Aeromonas hydrophila TaxID=644 RepID=UPI004055486F
MVDRLEKTAVGGFDVFKISKEAFSIYQDPELSLTENLDMVLLSLIADRDGGWARVRNDRKRILDLTIRDSTDVGPVRLRFWDTHHFDGA